ncbi:MAG: hypothetical protein J6M17_06710 [Ruminococcus sp.]|nr:hypothetical protein [Ruminococcus sp.]
MIQRQRTRRFSMKDKILLAVMILLTGVLVFYFVWNRPTHRSIAGIRDPIQKEASGSEQLEFLNYDIDMTYLYSYDIEGLVVKSTPYIGVGVYYYLSPMDVGLAWGKVAEYNDRMDFNWKQNNRYLSFEMTQQDIDNFGSSDEILCHCSNNHLITRDKKLRSEIRKIRAGDHIRIKGYLVNVDCYKPDGSGSCWHGSTVRDDTGAHACEVILVKEIEWLD